MKKTAVFWDIDSCPVPPFYDPSLVGPSIHLALEKLGYVGPFTITAVGKLKRTSHHVLGAISSTGIVVIYGDCGISSTLSELDTWELSNPAPATIMFICGSSIVEWFAHRFKDIQARGYKLLLAYPSKTDSKPLASKEWLWKHLLTDAMYSDDKLEARKPECSERDDKLVASAECLCQISLTDAMCSYNKLDAKRLFLLRECSERSQFDSFSCTICDSAWQSFEGFATHLDGLDHKVKSLERTANTDYLDSVTLPMLRRQAKAKRLAKGEFKNEQPSLEELRSLIKKKKKWEKLKEELKRRAELASDCFYCTLCRCARQSLEEFTTHLEGLDYQVKRFKVGVNIFHLNSVTLHMLEKEAERLSKKKFKNERAGSFRRKEVATLIKKKKKWEELKEKLKERDELASQQD